MIIVFLLLVFVISSVISPFIYPEIARYDRTGRLAFGMLATAIGLATIYVIVEKQFGKQFEEILYYVAVDIQSEEQSYKEQLYKEQLYAQRIEIIEKAKNSTDPYVIKMAEQVRANIAKEQAVEAQNSTERPTPIYFETLPTWKKILLLSILLFAIFVVIYEMNKSIVRDRLY